MKPFGSSSSMDQGSALASQDGLFEIALIITNQPGLDARSSQAVMVKVNQFTDRMLSEWTGYKPKVYVTGRTAFVAQISHSMEGDISLSAILSIAIVSGLFYVAFRRFLPLIGIVLILCLSALVALGVRDVGFPRTQRRGDRILLHSRGRWGRFQPSPFRPVPASAPGGPIA